jgi:hypothetical protein
MSNGAQVDTFSRRKPRGWGTPLSFIYVSSGLMLAALCLATLLFSINSWKPPFPQDAKFDTFFVTYRKTLQIHYRSCVLLHPPSNCFGWFTDGSVFHRFPPYTMTKIHKKRNFVIFSILNLHWYTPSIFAWIYLLSVFPWSTFSQ